MKNNIYKMLLLMIGIFLFSGCIHRELIISGTGSTQEKQASGDIAKSSPQLSTELQQKTPVSTSTTIIPRVPFPEEEYTALSKNGNATVKGSIYLSDAYGKKIYGKQTRLYLNPITSYSRQWYLESYLGGYKMEKADKRLYNYLKFTASNSQGKFAFYGVPKGSYYVIGMIKCSSECGYNTVRNIRIAKEVTVDGAGTVVVDLSKMID